MPSTNSKPSLKVKTRDLAEAHLLLAEAMKALAPRLDSAASEKLDAYVRHVEAFRGQGA